jgi:ATP-dependent DNA helicase PIF1
METLTSEQRAVFDALLANQNVFLTGGGGTGKSYLIQTIYEHLPVIRNRESELDIRIAVTAMTGCAAVLLSTHAKTLHSWAGIGLGKGTPDELIYKIRRNGRAKKNWTKTDLLILDEVSMLQPELLEKLDIIGRKMRNQRSKPFGGLQLLFIGDFLQLPPVTKGEEVRFAFESPLWSSLFHTSVELTEIHRQKDPVFQQILREARIGKLSADSISILQSRMNMDWRSRKIRPTLLFPRRAEVDLINDANLKALSGPRYTYKASIVTDENSSCGFNQRDEAFQTYLASFDRDASYLPELVLTLGAQVMLIKNRNMEKIKNKTIEAISSLVNGSRGVITGFREDSLHTPIVEFMNGMKLEIKPTNWEMEDYPGVYRTQVPLRPAYAITMHKSQGATLDCALIDIGDRIFEYGQAYVALSRVTALDSLYVHDFDPGALQAHPRVLAFYESLRAPTIDPADPADPA